MPAAPAPDRAGVHVLGIRHHGPGSARSLAAALAAIEPTVVLIEGPPEADGLIGLVADAGMVPPVAILVYRPDRPRDAVYYPFAEFSPEWQALRHALDRGIPARFVDLPVAHHFAAEEAQAQAHDQGTPPAEPDGELASAGALIEPEPVPVPDPEPAPAPPRRPVDPLGLLAKAAGFDDGERWWDYVVESRRHGAGSANADAVGMFRSILGAMAEVRAGEPAEADPREQRREAHMRQAIRAAQKEGHARIAVVCGAWHAPALDPTGWPPARLDAAYLKGLPKVKVAATWVPWTFGRLARDSGYGAGIVAPGWYDHLWTCRDGVAGRWLTRVARLLRDERLDASSASVIEAVRLADALASLRGRPVADLADLDEAALSVLCHGDPAPARLIARRLVVGERLGRVPDATPAVPLQADLARLQKRLRLAPKAAATALVLDLRNDNDRERSHLLHRLGLLGVGWGKLVQASGRGTFKEGWELEWAPELAVALIEASTWGTTVHDAAAALASDRAERAGKLAELTDLLDRAILADLPATVAAVMARVEAMAAASADVVDLMAALPPLANLSRYGSVRQVDAAAVAHAASGMVARVAIGLPLACHSLDDAAAGAMFAAIVRADGAITLMDRTDDLAAWHDALGRLATSATVHGLVAGRATRIRFDAGADDDADVARRMGLAVSPAGDPAAAASWVEGFLQGSGELLVHDGALFGIFDAWLASIPPAGFPAILPLVRRTFASFEGPLRRTLGELARDRAGGAAPGSRPTSPTGPGEPPLDHDRAAAVLPILALLLGLDEPGDGTMPP